MEHHTDSVTLYDWFSAVCRAGFSVSLNNFTALIGAPGDSLLFPDSGAALAVDLEYQRVHFSQSQYIVRENSHMRRIIIQVTHFRVGAGESLSQAGVDKPAYLRLVPGCWGQVERDGDLSGTLSVAYSTRDVTAFGVNRTYYDDCLKNIPQTLRNIQGCGDYMQHRGEVWIVV